MLRELTRYQVQCDDCGRGAGEPAKEAATALCAALRQGGYYHYEHGQECRWICPQCVARRQVQAKEGES